MAEEIAFLGFAEQSELIRDGETDFLKWNVLGLKGILLVNFLPNPLIGLKVGLALRVFQAPKTLNIMFRAESGEDIGGLTANLVSATPLAPISHTDSPFIRGTPHGWVVNFSPVPSPGLVIPKPGRYFAILLGDGREQIIGEFYCAVVDPPPLTPERVAAMKAHPRGVKAVRAMLGCNKCPSQLRIYAAFERDQQSEADGFTWYADIPTHFTCNCRATQFDVSSYKRNFYAPLLQPMGLLGTVSALPLYERSSIESLRVELVNLLNANPLEEALQQFIEHNPIILHQFPAQRLFFKPAILTRFNADFAVITPEKELVLIEIERANTRLLKSGGGQHSELTHAIDQIHDWLSVTRDHLLAVLDQSLRIPHDMVSTVRGVVIAGRDLGNDQSQLRDLKARYRSEVKLLTYDDLAASLAALAQSLSN